MFDACVWKGAIVRLFSSRKRRRIFRVVSWARTCAGSLATAMPRNIGKTFGVSFCAGIIGMVVLIFGNISSFRGAKAAGHVMSSEKGSPVRELHNVADNHQKGRCFNSREG